MWGSNKKLGCIKYYLCADAISSLFLFFCFFFMLLTWFLVFRRGEVPFPLSILFFEFLHMCSYAPWSWMARNQIVVAFRLSTIRKASLFLLRGSISLPYRFLLVTSPVSLFAEVRCCCLKRLSLFTDLVFVCVEIRFCCLRKASFVMNIVSICRQDSIRRHIGFRHLWTSRYVDWDPISLS